MKISSNMVGKKLVQINHFFRNEGDEVDDEKKCIKMIIYYTHIAKK